jgi:hypothetical protein
LTQKLLTLAIRYWPRKRFPRKTVRNLAWTEQG